MEHIRKSIINCLYEFSENDDTLIIELNRLIENHGKCVYPSIFQVLTHLDLEVDRARAHWLDIIEHRKKVSRLIGRDISLRTAICDYFCSVHKTLNNPVVVEIQVFEAKTHSAKYDNLTGLFNRQYFDEALEREISRAKRHKNNVSLLFLDIDDFKKVNDTYGHLAGDLVLKQVAAIVQGEIRNEDIAARYGGEEIVAILPETEKARAFIVGERIRKKIFETPLFYECNHVKITISGGLASFPIDAEEKSELIKNADLALYRAKGGGKNAIVFHSAEKRRFIRININNGVAIRTLGVGSIDEVRGLAKNLSLNGILVEIDSPIPIGNRVQLEISVEGVDSTMLIIGLVVRLEIYESKRYDIGIAFVEMDDSTQNEIYRYIFDS